MQRSLANSLDYHTRIFRDIPLVSAYIHQDELFLSVLDALTLPSPVPLTQLLPHSSVDLTSLSDTLAMTRQEQLQMTRKLRSIRDSVQDRKIEWDELDRRIVWLKEHDSEERRGRGSCARQVNGMVLGFDKLLGGMHRQMYHAMMENFR
jgi:hypothetical protein